MTIDISEESLAKESADLLKILLKDRTTKKNIVWATHSYELLGKGFAPSDRINPSKVTGNYANLIQPRSEKSKYEQKDRTKIRAEVFTPTWLVEKQNGYVESELELLSLEEYVDLRWLEITCGEAPYMVTRYDTVTGEEIPLSERVGFVDRKLQRISREVSDEATFYELVKKAYRASYGYEYQGDSLLLARENLLATFEDYYLAKTGNQPTLEQKKEIATIISYNVFQMDGLKKNSPYSATQGQSQQLSLFSDELEVEQAEESKTQIKDWKKNKMIGFERLSSEESEMKFDVVIGNPPYQDNTLGENISFAPPVYHNFLDESVKIADRSILITPGRFLFNAGGTPKSWNNKILTNEHVKVEYYEQDSSKVFSGTDIKGGVAIIYQDNNSLFEPIDTFTPFKELNEILHLVMSKNLDSFTKIVSGRGVYKLSKRALEEYPEIEKIQSKGHKYDVGSGAFRILKNIIFSEEKKFDSQISFLGLYNSKRVYYYADEKNFALPDHFYKYKVFIPKSNGSGAIGEVLSTPLIGEPLIGEPLIGATETFLSIGGFETYTEASNCLKYIKTKFARALLGVLKITQDNTKEKWAKVPLFNFSVNSDIDWSQSVSDIDRQLYEYFDLTPEHIAFIETHVREMD